MKRNIKAIIKKFFLLVIMLLFFGESSSTLYSAAIIPSSNANADSSPVLQSSNLTINELKTKSGDECVQLLIKNGLVLSNVYKSNLRLASESVKMIIKDLDSGLLGFGVIPYNYTELSSLAQQVMTILEKDIIARQNRFTHNVTLDELKTKSGKECISLLEENGLVLPKAYQQDEQLAEKNVKYVINDLAKGTFTDGAIPYSYTEIIELAKQIMAITQTGTAASYTLKDSAL